MTDSVIAEKRCRGCGTVKPASEFHKWARGKDGLADNCKLCKKTKWQPRVYEISVTHGVCVKCGETKTAGAMVRRTNLPTGIWNVCLSCQSEIDRQRYVANPEPVKARARQYHHLNRDKILERNKQRYASSPELRARIASANLIWQKANPERLRESQRISLRRIRATSPTRKITDRISQGIRFSLLNGMGGRSWQSLVGYTTHDLIDRLKKTVPAGYSWEDAFTRKLEIDHIVPVSAFNFTTPEDIDFRRCWALKNLRLLPVADNRSKGNKLINPFQPSLSGI